jgi:hypothetical protein
VHRWLIKLNALDETEISRISELFRDEAGASGSFTFTDPWSGTTFADCSFEQDELAEELLGEMTAGTTLIIRENPS